MWKESPLPQGKESLVSIWHANGLAPEPVSTLWSREKSLAFTGNRTPVVQLRSPSQYRRELTWVVSPFCCKEAKGRLLFRLVLFCGWTSCVFEWLDGTHIFNSDAFFRRKKKKELPHSLLRNSVTDIWRTQTKFIIFALVCISRK
jgi:hypothetical protein